MNKVIIGFTGTQIGMNQYQINTVTSLLTRFEYDNYIVESVHHGDCVGADTDFHNICKRFKFDIIIHPPKYDGKRSYCNKDGYTNVKVLPVKDYMDRNQDIVDACDTLISTPKDDSEVIRSGTWATIRRGKKAGKNVIIVYRNRVEFYKGKTNEYRTFT